MHTIDHLGIAVKSLAQARKFYEQLGLEVLSEETVPHEKVKVAMIPLGQSRIELLEATSPDSVVAKFVEKRGQVRTVCIAFVSAALLKPRINWTLQTYPLSLITICRETVPANAGSAMGGVGFGVGLRSVRPALGMSAADGQCARSWPAVHKDIP